MFQPFSLFATATFSISFELHCHHHQLYCSILSYYFSLLPSSAPYIPPSSQLPYINCSAIALPFSPPQTLYSIDPSPKYRSAIPAQLNPPTYNRKSASLRHTHKIPRIIGCHTNPSISHPISIKR